MNSSDILYQHEKTESSPSIIRLQKFVKVMYLLYIILSYFEIYLAGFIGTSTKYLMLLIICVLFYLYGGKIRISRYWVSFFLWFIYWCISILWSSMVNNSVQAHFLSQIGIVLFIMAIDGRVLDEGFIRLNLQGHLWCSALFGILSVLYHKPFFDGYAFVARQVLTLFGRQNDPNNCAAFLLTGIAIAAYSVIYEKKYPVIHLAIIAINSYATLLTGSRAGLVGIGLVAVVFVFLPSQDRKVDVTGGIKKLIFLVIAGIAIYYLVSHFLPTASLDRLLAFNEYQAGSGRTIKWKGALEFFYQKPIIGWGWGGLDFRSIGYADSAHNTFLTLLCEGGIVGLGLFMFPIFLLSQYALKTKNVMVIILLISGLFPSFMIDAINKRFLWNAVIVAILLTNYYHETGKYVTVWKPDEIKE